MIILPISAFPPIESKEDAIGALLALLIVFGSAYSYLHWDDISEKYQEATITDQEKFQRSVDEKLEEIADKERSKRFGESIAMIIDSKVKMMSEQEEKLKRLDEDIKEFLQDTKRYSL